MKTYQWARWPWKHCHAVADEGRPGEWSRCDLIRGHGGEHRAERGMYDIVWASETHVA